MPRENDLEGVQDQGGKHGGQKHMPKPEPRYARSEPRPGQAPDQGIVRDERGQEQPRDKERAQQSAEQIRSNDELSRTVHPVVRNVPVTRSC